MLRTLLAQRFHMTAHIEKKELPVWALLVAKGGIRFGEAGGEYDPAKGREMPIPFAGYGDDVHMQIRSTEVRFATPSRMFPCRYLPERWLRQGARPQARRLWLI